MSDRPPDAPPPPGYVPHPLSRPLNDSAPSRCILLLPAHVKTGVDQARALAFQLRVEEHIREEERRRAQNRIENLQATEAEAAQKTQQQAAGQAQGNTESKTDVVSDPDPDPGLGADEHPEILYPVYPVYTETTLRSFKTRASVMSPDKELRRRDEEVAKLLQAKGCDRPIGIPESPRETMEELRERMPHFGEVIDCLRDHLLLAARSGKGSRLPPMLLGGEPGIGKTHFAHLLAEVLGTTSCPSPASKR